MNHMYVSVVATRRATQTKRRSVHIVSYTFGGPQKAIEQFATILANQFTGNWEFNVMQITGFEYKAFREELDLVNDKTNAT